MSPEYQELLQKPKCARVLEHRSAVLKLLLAEHRLAEPKSVEYKPLKDCVYDRCFVNVDAQVENAGGRAEHGWMFWEIENISVYTLAHATWISPQGKRLDITPQKITPDRRVLFLPDARVTLKRGYTSGFTTLLSKDPRVIALEGFASEMERLLDECFEGIGQYFDFPLEAMRVAADRLALPTDVADYMINRRLQQMRNAVALHGSS